MAGLGWVLGGLEGEGRLVTGGPARRKAEAQSPRGQRVGTGWVLESKFSPKSRFACGIVSSVSARSSQAWPSSGGGNRLAFLVSPQPRLNRNLQPGGLRSRQAEGRPRCGRSGTSPCPVHLGPLAGDTPLEPAASRGLCVCHGHMWPEPACGRRFLTQGETAWWTSCGKKLSFRGKISRVPWRC